MQVPYDWYAAATSTSTVPTTYPPNEYGPSARTYPSPAPSINPSPGPLPHLSLQEPFVHHSRMNMPYNGGGGRRELTVHDATGRFTEQRMDMQHPYHDTQSPSTSMSSPYSPYSQRNTLTYFDDPRIPSPALSSGSGSGSASGSGSVSGSARSPLSAGISTPVASHADRPQSSSMPTRRIQKHTKHRLLASDRKAICLYHLSMKHARQEDIANRFGCERSTVSKILKQKERWLNITTATEESTHTAKSRGSKFPFVEAELVDRFLERWHNSHTIISDQLLRTTALDIAKDQGHAPGVFKASSGWLENFKHRYKIRRGVWLDGDAMNKAKYGTEVLPQSTYPVPATPPPLIPIDEHLEVFNSSRPSQGSSSLHQPPSDEIAHSEADSSDQPQKSGEAGGDDQPGPLSVSDIILQNAPENYGKRLHPLFLPAADARERFMQLRFPQDIYQNPSFSLTHIQASADILASFFDNEGRGVLKPAEKRVLEHIRNALLYLDFDANFER